MSTETDTDSAPGTASDVAFGLEENVAGALSYIFLVGLVFLLVEKTSDFVRFHAAQSVVLAVAFIGLSFVVGIVSLVVGLIPFVGFLGDLLWWAFSLAAFVFWLFLLYQAFQGERYEVPVVAGLAEQLEDAI